VRRHVLTGAPGTGKTTLPTELTHLGTCVGEPARELIAEHREATGEQSLDGRPEQFVARLVERSVEKYRVASQDSIYIYDRGIPDCAAYAIAFGIDPEPALEAARRRRYDEPILVLPPWEAIYSVDDMRRMDFAMTLDFHNNLMAVYQRLGYDLVVIPEATVGERAKIVAGMINRNTP